MTIRDHLRQRSHNLSRDWTSPLYIAVALSVLFVTVRIARSLPGGLPLNSDPLSYLFSGYHTSIGYPAFLYSFDTKGPAVQVLSAALHFLTPENTVAAWIAVLLGAMGTVAATGIVAETLDRRGIPSVLAVAGAIVPWGVLPFGLHFLTGLSLKSTIAFIPLAVVVSIDSERYAAATGLAALGAAFWQPTVGLIPLSLVFGFFRTSDIRQYIVHTTTLISAVIVITTGPFIIWGAGSQLLVQSVVAPIVTSSGGVKIRWLTGLYSMFKAAFPLAVLSYGGLAIGVWKSYYSQLWRPLTAVGVWTLLVMPTLSQRGFFDLIFYAPLVGVFATVAAYTAIRASPPTQKVPAVVVAGILVILTGLAVWGSIPYDPRLTGDPSAAAWRYLAGDVPIGCHADTIILEKRWIEIVGGADRERCMTLREALHRLT